MHGRLTLGGNYAATSDTHNCSTSLKILSIIKSVFTETIRIISMGLNLNSLQGYERGRRERVSGGFEGRRRTAHGASRLAPGT